MPFEQEAEARRWRNLAESREGAVEAGKERNEERLEQKLAARERAEQLHRETKTAQQQQQNIMVNMQQVVAAVAAIRAQLGLGGSVSIPAVAQDERSLALIKKKLAGLRGQLSDLQAALFAEFTAEVSREQPAWAASEIEVEAARRVMATLQRFGVAETP